MISSPRLPAASEKVAIRQHYDLATPFYRLVWGPHIHHGLWPADLAGPAAASVSPRLAQEHLVDALADLAGAGAGDRVLDVGCGMGGPAIRLARRGCRVTGITLSGVQSFWASWAARLSGAGRRAEFTQTDAETASFPLASFDLLWSIECTEHLVEKAAFFQRAAGWLAPGGRLVIAVWLAGEDAERVGLREQVETVCDAFLCPSLGSFIDYVGWLNAAGLVVEQTIDWTRRVEQTWEICDRRVRRLRLGGLARVIDQRQAFFLDHFQTLLEAYRSGAMQYGCILARKPS